MADQKEIKSQRDRFLAFSFASADLLIEVAEDGRVVYATGAAKALTGIKPEKLPGNDWLDLFSLKDRAILIGMRKRAREGERRGPFQVRMSEDLGDDQETIVTGIKMPESDSFYVAVSFPNPMVLKLAGIVSAQEEMQLLDKDTFLHAATQAFDFARSLGEDIDMTLFDIPRTKEIKSKLGDELWGQFIQSMTEVLSASSVDGMAIAQITEGRYSVIHDKDIDSETLRIQIEELGKNTDPNGEGFEVSHKTVSADLESLSERETTKALIYTINEFERRGTALNIETLNTGFKAYVSANAQKIHHFKKMVEQLDFNLEFQPIVDMETRTLSHFEIVSRFRGETSTQEWVIFGEDIGMAADFDMAVCERVINYLRYKASNNRMKFAMNLSGQSMQNEQFFKTLIAKLDMYKELAQRMVFEITESTTITELALVNHFIQVLQGKGYKVCLDDFGAGAASFKYIQQLHIDYIKIDGQYTRKLMHSHRDQVLIKNLAQLCRDLHIKVIAEQLETDEQVKKMTSLGVELGQGYYFGYPDAQPEFNPDKLPARPPQARKS